MTSHDLSIILNNSMPSTNQYHQSLLKMFKACPLNPNPFLVSVLLTSQSLTCILYYMACQILTVELAFSITKDFIDIRIINGLPNETISHGLFSNPKWKTKSDMVN